MAKWMNNIHKSRYWVDVILLILFVAAASQKATGNFIHEWLSLALILPLVVHLLMHWQWLVNIPKKLFSPKLALKIRINILLNGLLYLSLLLVMLSGVMISKDALPTLGLFITRDHFWNAIHHLSTNYLLGFIGVHIAMHIYWITRQTKSIFRKRAFTNERQPQQSSLGGVK